MIGRTIYTLRHQESRATHIAGQIIGLNLNITAVGMETLIRIEHMILRTKVNSAYILNSNIGTIHSLQRAVHRSQRCLSRSKIEGIQILNRESRTISNENIIALYKLSLVILIIQLIGVRPCHCPIYVFFTINCYICTTSCDFDRICVITCIILC